jgi:asparagine synthase (glutamine-hydrolysing)
MRDLAQTYHGASATTMVDRMLALDIKYTLSDNDLPKVTTMCEMAGIDTAFPFLQDAVVDFARQLPAEQKVHRSKLRVIFRNALRDFLPEEVLTKKKHGFGLPFGLWLATDRELKELANDALASLQRRGIVRPRFVEQLMRERLEEHPQYYGGYVWVLMLLELWFRRDDAARAGQ